MDDAEGRGVKFNRKSSQKRSNEKVRRKQLGKKGEEAGRMR